MSNGGAARPQTQTGSRPTIRKMPSTLVFPRSLVLRADTGWWGLEPKWGQVQCNKCPVHVPNDPRPAISGVISILMHVTSILLKDQRLSNHDNAMKSLRSMPTFKPLNTHHLACVYFSSDILWKMRTKVYICIFGGNLHIRRFI